MTSPATIPAPTIAPNISNTPIVILVIGMAGTGKSSCVAALCSHASRHGLRHYAINLDPAVRSLGYEPNIDIRDSVDYAGVMSKYELGPNGAIITAMNLFAAQFDEVAQLIERRADELDLIFVDTPGQIEVFNWSASGTIITDVFAATFPTVLAFVADAPRCTAPTTFMSNILYACSILYKSQLPLLLSFNKTDLVAADYAAEWLSDVAALGDAISAGHTYLSNFTHALALALEPFYAEIQLVEISAATGAGFDTFLQRAREATANYEEILAAKRAVGAEGALQNDALQDDDDVVQSGDESDSNERSIGGSEDDQEEGGL